METLYSIIPFAIVLLIVSIKQVNQYERGVKFTLGRFTGLVDPGWRLVLPIIQSMRKVDIRTKATDVPDQEAITKDNVSCKINAVIYYKVVDAGKAVLEVENVWYAVNQLAQTTMRNVVGQLALDELLSQRDQASLRIREIIERDAIAWGLDVLNVELKDITLPEDMKRTISLAWRLQKPNANTYWWMGGGIRPGMPINQSAAGIFKRETKMSLDPSRLTLVASIDYHWKDHAQEPMDIGCHMIGYTFFFVPTPDELEAVAQSLDAKEYDTARGLTEFGRNRIVELVETHVMHPAVLTVYDQIFSPQ
jgi:hypothetical protein